MNQLPGQPDAPRPALRVLVVDDQPDTVDAWAMLLRLHGHAVAVALDGLEALAIADAHGPHVVLCDITMPRLDGYGVASKLRQKGPARPFLVAVTAHCSDEDRRRCLEAGFDRHLTKPAEPAEVVQLLKDLASRLAGTAPSGGPASG
jgi:CheY-like chemotaxis protein